VSIIGRKVIGALIIPSKFVQSKGKISMDIFPFRLYKYN